MKTENDMYRHFSPLERIALMVDAMARNDDAERRRLVETCPRKTYTESDGAYADGIKLSMKMAWTTGSSLRYFLGAANAMNTLQNSIGVLLPETDDLPELCFWGGYWKGKISSATALGHPAPPRPEDDGPDEIVLKDPEVQAVVDGLQKCNGKIADNIYEILDLAQIESTGALATVWEGFTRFCRQALNVEPESLLAAADLPISEEVKVALSRYPSATPNEKLSQRYADSMFGRWERSYLVNHGTKSVQLHA